MKKILAFLCFTAAAVAASAPTFTLGAFYVGRLSVDPTIAADGSMSGCNVSVWFKQDLVNVDTQEHVQQSGFQASKTIDCLANATKTVTFQFNGQAVTMSYGEIVTAAAAAALQEAPTN